MGPQPGDSIRTVGQYELCGVMSQGGMATVHYGRLMGPGGFSRTVAIKQLHARFGQDPQILAMFTDEARVTGRLHHPNIVPMLDVVALKDELFLVMEYVQGETLAHLIQAAREAHANIPPQIVSAIMSGVLYGLHAAHEARHPRKGPLNIVHRDVSPENVLVGVDGIARVFDFGVAKALHRMSVTQPGQIKGKVAYLAPEQIRGAEVSRLADLFSAAAVLWEALTLRRLFGGLNDEQTLTAILTSDIEPPSEFAATVAFDPTSLVGTPSVSSADIDEVVLRGLERDPSKRFRTAKEMAMALEKAMPPAPQSVVGEWVETLARKTLSEKAKVLAQLGSDASISLTSGIQDIAENLSVPSPPLSHVTDLDVMAPDSGGNNPHVSTMPEPIPVPPELSRPPISHERPRRKVDRTFQAAIAIGVFALVIVAISLVYLIVALTSS